MLPKIIQIGEAIYPATLFGKFAALRLDIF